MNDKARMIKQEKIKRLFSFPLPDGTDPSRLFAPHAHKPYSLFFDGNRHTHPLSRYSYLCVDPFETIEMIDGNVVIKNNDNVYNYKTNPFTALSERIKHYGGDHRQDKSLPPFQGGAAGYFGYDLVRILEKLPSFTKKDNTGPDMAIGLYDCIVSIDNKTGKSWIVVQAENEDEAEKRNRLYEKQQDTATTNHPVKWTAEKSETDYKSDIQTVIDYIYAGDIFQANLSRRLTAQEPENFDRYAHYCHLRRVNPAPYSAYLNFEHTTISSSSPERFLSVSGRNVETKPIKGTMPSSSTHDELQSSEKDRAENAMIVDLLRNDLSKCCEDHSVMVEDFCAIETFEGLHHMVSTIKSRLRADKNSLNLLESCFPGGSITGAPKIRAMEIIEELEPCKRGIYCGSIGLIGWNGDMETNIAIRTLVYEDGKIHLQTGGGITADSNPENELQETLVKAKKILESFEAIESGEKSA